MKGIDVSHHQGRIDWSAVRQGQISFAFIKTTEGGTMADAMFHRNWESARNRGIFRGGYHFFRPQVSAEHQAHNFLRVLHSDPGELPPVLDLEVLDGVSPAQVLNGAKRWMEIVASALACKPIIYTGSSFWQVTLGDSRDLADHPLWIAHYTNAPSPRMPSAWKQWTFWQYSQTGTVPGITGHVDLNVFNGSGEALERMTRVIAGKLEQTGICG